eukprot:gene2132-2419_t
MRESMLLAKLAQGDLHSRDTCYHKSCFNSFTNKYRSFAKKESPQRNQRNKESIAYAKLVMYIEENFSNRQETALYSKLSHLAIYYVDLLKQQNADIPERVNTTRFKECLIDLSPSLCANQKGRDVYLAYKDDLGSALHFANEDTVGSQAMHLAKTAKLIRQEMFEIKQHFDSSFSPNSQKQSVPDSLLCLVNMLLGGTIIDDDEDKSEKCSIL